MPFLNIWPFLHGIMDQAPAVAIFCLLAGKKFLRFNMGLL